MKMELLKKVFNRSFNDVDRLNLSLEHALNDYSKGNKWVVIRSDQSCPGDEAVRYIASDLVQSSTFSTILLESEEDHPILAICQDELESYLLMEMGIQHLFKITAPEGVDSK